MNNQIKWKVSKSLYIHKSGIKEFGTIQYCYYSPYHNEFACVYEYWSIDTGKLAGRRGPFKYIQL